METGLTKQRVIAELTKSTHGDLAAYLPITKQAVVQDAEFFAHLIAWNEKKGQIRDAKVALPVASLQPKYGFADNSLAHLALQDPIWLLKGLGFARDAGIKGYNHAFQRLVTRYLRVREAKPNWWTATAVQHRASMKTLYALYHVKPLPKYEKLLFKRQRLPGSVFEAIANLQTMPPNQAAAAIAQHRIPFLIAVQALGKRSRDVDLLLAIINSMSGPELVNNSKMLEKLGVRNSPELRAAYEQGLLRVVENKGSTLKTSKAIEAVSDTVLKTKLEGVQEKQIKKIAIDGNWLVLGDKSSSMRISIEASRHISSSLAKFVKGDVHLIFFDTSPRYIPVTGKTYNEILELTKHVTGNGNTGIGCGLQYAYDKNLDINGIAIVSDGGENTPPFFFDIYKRYCARSGTQPPVYLYLVQGSDTDKFSPMMKMAGIEFQTFDLTGGVDYYSLPNMVQTMRASRYSLLDEIMETPLLTLDEVFNDKEMRNVA